jgi:Flp pilus assembly protein TadD
MLHQRPIILQSMLVAVTLLAYVPVISGGFTWDDDAYVTGNQLLKSPSGLGSIWFKPSALPQYYPLVHTTFWLEYHLWELRPAGYHLINILLHACNALLLWQALETLNVPGAALAGFLFALHPVNVESVAWITERKNVLSQFFYLLSLLSYLKFAPPESHASKRSSQWKYYWLSLVAFLCALLSKTVTCTLPAAILLIDWWKHGRISRRDIARLLPMLIGGLTLAYTTIWLEKTHVGARGVDWTLSFVERCLIAGRALWFYAGKLIWPADLTFIYPKWTISAKSAAQYLFPGAAAAVFLCLYLMRRRIGRGPIVCICFFAGSLVPALGFFDIYPMLFSYVADHFQYLASMGLVAGFAAFCETGYRRFADGASWAKLAAAGLLCVVLSVLTWKQGEIYRSQETLWQDTLRKNPACWMAWENLGVYYAGQGRLDDAAASYSEALRLRPNDANIHCDIGTALFRQGRFAEADAYFYTALRLRPLFYEAQFNLGMSLFSQKRYAEAARYLQQALQLKGDEAEAHHILGRAMANLGDPRGAVQHYRQALALNPKWPAAMNDLAWLLATAQDPEIRSGAEAVRLARLACDSAGYHDPNYLDTLAAACAEAGDFPEAVRVVQMALEMGRSSKQAASALQAFQDRLNLYLLGKSYRDQATPSH